MKYRRDIDGLRTVAVVPVVLFHGGYSAFSGGFVGVDVFFVISGYLITTIIASEVQAGTFSILRFYERRVRRIFPALFAMIAVTLAASAAILLPADFNRLGQSAIWASLFGANFFFWWTVDYFGAHEIQPLLHTWSLAVEEQFYVVFPPLMVVVYRFLGTRWIWPLAAILAVSLAWSELVVQTAQPDAFYLPHLRAWELMIGAVLALGVLPEVTGRALREAIGIIGLAMIAWAVVSYTDETVFPGLSALVPCAGAAAIIYAGRSGDYLVGRILGVAPMVWVGLISYSLYLWHWPILQLAEYYNIVPLDDWQAAAAVAASFGAATLSYWVVERPFRRTTRNRAFVFASGTAMTASAIALGLVVFLTGGFPARFSPEAARYASMMDKELYFPIYDRGRCFLDYDQGAEDYDVTTCAPSTDRPRILIWGDSFAANLYPGLKRNAERRGIDVVQYTATSCRPIVRGHKRCDAIYQRFPSVLAEIAPDLVVMTGSWASMLRKYGAEDFSVHLQESIRLAEANGAKVIVAGQSPTYGFDLPRLGFMYPEIRGQDRATYRARDWSVLNAIVREAADATNAEYYDFYEDCAGTDCTVFLSGDPLHWDGGHMTLQGSLFYTGRLAEAAGELLGDSTNQTAATSG